MELTEIRQKGILQLGPVPRLQFYTIIMGLGQKEEKGNRAAGARPRLQFSKTGTPSLCTKDKKREPRQRGELGQKGVLQLGPGYNG